MKRSEIDEKFKWDLTKIYLTEEDFVNDYNHTKTLIPTLSNYKDLFLQNENIFIEFMQLVETILRSIDKMYCYAHLSLDVEPENPTFQNNYSMVSSLLDQYNTTAVFIDLEILKNSEKALDIIKTDKAKQYTKFVTDILRTKPHIASEEVENILAMASDVLQNSYETYSSIRLDFNPVIIDGKEHFLNQETLLEFLKNENEDIRKQSYENLYSQYKKFSNVFANTLAGTIKKDVFYSKVRNFDTPLEFSIFNDAAPKELFYKVLDMANNKYHSYLLDYVELRKEILNKEKLEIYDMNLPLATPPDTNYSLDTAFDLIFKATENFGEEYRNILEKARDERWVDYYTHEGKRHGAYSSGCYDANPYILMSFLDNMESVFTLAHELGHSVHTYLSSKNQPFISHDYKIFVAEVASTVNENLLMNLLLKTATTKEEKLYLLARKIDAFIGCNYRQPFFANFENILHERILNGEGLSNQYMTNLYEDLTKEYWGDSVNLSELTKYSCYSVPHFYYNYYVYKYTIGMCISSVLANRISDGDIEQIQKYLNFLKSGCSKDPIELLSDAGCNPLDDSLYETAFNDFKKLLDEFRNLISQ